MGLSLILQQLGFHRNLSEYGPRSDLARQRLTTISSLSTAFETLSGNENVPKRDIRELKDKIEKKMIKLIFVLVCVS